MVSHHNENEELHTPALTPANNSIFTVMTVFVMKRDSAYPQLRVNDHTVPSRSVFVYE
jgi:hypothetical protein